MAVKKVRKLQPSSWSLGKASVMRSGASSFRSGALSFRRFGSNSKGATDRRTRSISSSSSNLGSVTDRGVDRQLDLEALQLPRSVLEAARLAQTSRFALELQVSKMLADQDRMLPMSPSARTPRHLAEYAKRLPPPVPPPPPTVKPQVQNAEIAIDIAAPSLAAEESASLKLSAFSLCCECLLAGSCAETFLSLQEAFSLLGFLLLGALSYLGINASAWVTRYEPQDIQSPPSPPAAPDWADLAKQSFFSFASERPLQYLSIDFGLAVAIGTLVLFWRDLREWQNQLAWQKRYVRLEDQETAAVGRSGTWKRAVEKSGSLGGMRAIIAAAREAESKQQSPAAQRADKQQSPAAQRAGKIASTSPQRACNGANNASSASGASGISGASRASSARCTSGASGASSASSPSPSPSFRKSSPAEAHAPKRIPVGPLPRNEADLKKELSRCADIPSSGAHLSSF